MVQASRMCPCECLVRWKGHEGLYGDVVVEGQEAAMVLMGGEIPVDSARPLCVPETYAGMETCSVLTD